MGYSLTRPTAYKPLTISSSINLFLAAASWAAPPPAVFCTAAGGGLGEVAGLGGTADPAVAAPL